MNSRKTLVNVAVQGPFRRTFAYHLPPDIASLQPGQRVLVGFGRTRTVGFYLGPQETDPGVDTKPIVRALDPTSFFSDDLFRLCLWLADYYFANPADCLATALPSILKTRRPVKLIWGNVLDVAIPGEVRSLFRPGKAISGDVIHTLRGFERGLLNTLTANGAIEEVWPTSEQPRMVVRGYRVADPALWDPFFRRKRVAPEKFEGEQTRVELRAAGWSDTHIRQAVNAGLLDASVAEQRDRILDFVAPREDVALLQPNHEQQKVIDTVAQMLGKGFQASLLHGITGSGKTLVYCHLVSRVLEAGQSALVLTPEIALTGATLAYFRGFFGDLVTVIHSAMTSRERMESWNGIRRGRYRVVIGPRSAVFAPIQDPGIVIVDEEHDGSYKQDDPAPRFNGRDAAVMRGQLCGIPVLLGSASPSVESYHNATSGRYTLLELKERPGDARLPVVRIVNMGRDRLEGELSFLSYPLKKEIGQRLDRGDQVILFLNRRGYSPQLKCLDCGHVPECPQCNIRLTYHKVGRKLTCHYCGHLESARDRCDRCGHSYRFPGAGTQKVEEQIIRLFPQANVLRFDSDTASGRKNAHQLLKSFAAREYNLLLGTQMVTKGLDLAGVTLVGVLSADIGLDMPDFRASEKTFDRLLQVAGRSGRGDQPGDVFIQTYYPSHDVVEDAARQDFHTFFEREIESRRLHDFPPFCRCVRFVLAGKEEALLREQSLAFSQRLEQRLSSAGTAGLILGPAACPLKYLRYHHRHHILVMTRQVTRLVRMLAAWEVEQANFGLSSGVKVAVDVDPYEMM
ncbi:MAG: primosomal protein N' [candidate division Zixibacteria bacterium]|nr:primosomal protein N' [candidate division Zixibacteria bacterium]